MAYEDYKELSESAAKSTKREADYAKSKATTRVEKTINDFKNTYDDKAALIKRKSGKPFENEFGYIPFIVREEYEESHVSKKSGTGYHTSYSATVSSSGDISIDPHSDSVNYKYYAIDTERREVSESISFKLVKKGASNIVKQKEAAFIKAYSNYSSAYNGIDHATKTVVTPTPKLKKVNGKKVLMSCIINLIMSMYMVYWSIANFINDYYWWESNYTEKALPVGSFIFAFLAFFAIINNLIRGISIKKVYIDPEKVGPIGSRNRLSSYYSSTCIYYVFSLALIGVAIVGTVTSILYYIDMLLTIIIIIASVVKLSNNFTLCKDSRNDVIFINNSVSSTVTSEDLLSSGMYENMVKDLNEICAYNLINIEAEEWWYDYESVLHGEMSVKSFARIHPEFIVGHDPIDSDDPGLDYLD